MVVKGRGALKKPKEPPRPSPTSLISKIASLQRKPDKEKALDLLHRVAVSVAPIMRENSLKVGLLSEFFPKDQRLLGLNVNRGQKVLVRLRSPYNEHQFLPFTDVLGTTLHELVHNHLGPHNKAFYDRLEKYKQRYHDISMKSAYETTGYFALNTVLGGRPRSGVDIKKVRAERLAAKKLYKSEVRKLGTLYEGVGKQEKPQRPLRELIRDAAERRVRDNKWCAEEHATTRELEPSDNELEIEIIKEIVHDGDAADGGLLGRVVKSEPNDGISVDVVPSIESSVVSSKYSKTVASDTVSGSDAQKVLKKRARDDFADKSFDIIELDDDESEFFNKFGKQKISTVLNKKRRKQRPKDVQVVDLT